MTKAHRDLLPEKPAIKAIVRFCPGCGFNLSLSFEPLSSIRPSQILRHQRAFPLLLVGCLLDRRRCGFRRYFTLRDRYRDIVDNAANGWPEVLVEKVLMVGGLGQDVRDLPEERIRYRRRRPLVYGDITAARRSLFGVFLLAEELEEVDGLRRRALGDEKSVNAPSVSVAFPFPPGTTGKAKMPMSSSGSPLPLVELGPCMAGSNSNMSCIAPLPSPNIPAASPYFVAR